MYMKDNLNRARKMAKENLYGVMENTKEIYMKVNLLTIDKAAKVFLRTRTEVSIKVK